MAYSLFSTKNILFEVGLLENQDSNICSEMAKAAAILSATLSKNEIIISQSHYDIAFS